MPRPDYVPEPDYSPVLSLSFISHSLASMHLLRTYTAIMRMLLLTVFFYIHLLVQAKLGDTHEKHHEAQRLLVHINYQGSSPPTPLGLCQGDCDKDDDCKGSLVCFQRDARQDVPGCSGGTDDISKADYCIEPTSSNNNLPASQSNFRLKLYWEPGYFWQEETIERKWCMECPGASCSIGDMQFIHKCGDSSEHFDFVPVSGGHLIRIHGKDYCLEKSDRSIYVRSCDANKPDQHWVANNGSFDGSRFEITPANRRDLCAHNTHHPKDGEEIRLDACSTARVDTTSYWNRY